jgi:cytochrome c peroxidase
MGAPGQSLFYLIALCFSAALVGTEALGDSDLIQRLKSSMCVACYVFKVPSLRNVALTAPCIHDGSAKRLETAVGAMDKYQLGQPLSSEDIDQTVLFLRMLTGKCGGKPL